MNDTLFESARHEPLAGGVFTETAAREAIGRIAQRLRAEVDAERGWLSHPLDDPDAPDERVWPLYHGAAGVVAALRRLSGEGAIDPVTPPDGAALWPVAADLTVQALGDYRHGTASLLLGETGARLLQWQAAVADGDDTLAEQALDRIAACVDGNASNPCLEPLWGGSGTLLAAIWLAEATGDARWADRVRHGAQWLFDAMDQGETAEGGPAGGDGACADERLWGWTPDLYGRRVDYLGAGHGIVGIAYPFLRGAAFLSEQQVHTVLQRVQRTLQALAQWGTSAEGRPMLNWPGFRHWPPGARHKVLVQDCHGAAGIVTRLAGVPRTAQWDEMLSAAGELVWQAGPLSKGAGICHGTAGNGFALLALWQRTGEPLWLERARAFAMHALAQVEDLHAQHGRSRPSLWTGDPGVALFAWRCIQGRADLPTLHTLP